MNITFFLGFAKAVKVEDLPFLINWCGPDVKSMVVDDKACLTSLVNMIAAIDDLQPDIDGSSFDPILAQSLFKHFNFTTSFEVFKVQYENSKESKVGD